MMKGRLLVWYLTLLCIQLTEVGFKYEEQDKNSNVLSSCFPSVNQLIGVMDNNQITSKY